MDNVFSPFVLAKLKYMTNGAGHLGMSILFGLIVAINSIIQVIGGKLFLRGVKIRDVEKFSRMF